MSPQQATASEEAAQTNPATASAAVTARGAAASAAPVADRSRFGFDLGVQM